MIPCRVSLQALQVTYQNCSSRSQVQTKNKPKVSLTLNQIFYDQIKLFQTKYFCLTTKDLVGIQVSVEIDQNQSLVSQMDIKNAFKLVLQSEVIQIKLNSRQERTQFSNSSSSGNLIKLGIKQIIIKLGFEPVKAFCNKKLSETNDIKNVERLIQQNTISHYNDTQNNLEISFSHRQPNIQQRQVLRLQERERQIEDQLYRQKQISRQIQRQISRSREKLRQKQLLIQRSRSRSRQNESGVQTFEYNPLAPKSFPHLGISIASEYKKIMKQPFGGNLLASSPKVSMQPLQPSSSYKNNLNHNMGSNSSIYLNPSNGAYNHYGSPNSSLKLNNSSQLLKYSNSYRDVPLFAETLKSPPDENESLQSLAQQRQKILCELFGRFKPNR